MGGKNHPAITVATRWYPWGIQQLVSTYELTETRGGEDQTNKTQSAKICPNLHYRGGVGGEVFTGRDQLNPKCQDLSKTAFSRGGGGGGGARGQTNSTQSVQICIFSGGGGVQTNSTQSAKICPNLHFGRGGGVQTVGALSEF